MHDRRIDGKTHTFGNYGALYKRAMTWYDHETDSVWSQPTGSGLIGTYQGIRLDMIPVEVVPWATWLDEHPDTKVLDVGNYASRRGGVNPFEFRGDTYVVGVALGDEAKAYPFELVSSEIVVNDHIGDLPVLVYANPETRSVHIFARQVQDRTLFFEWVDGQIRDLDTGSLWGPSSGLASEGELRGQLLKELPYSTAFDWAWEDFYPHTEVYS